jgi:serine/threonine-protein kinase
MYEPQAQRPDPLIGRTITGSYVIREKIAEGGMGAVYVAVNELGRRKVVKVLLGDLADSPVIRERFMREARAAARLADKPHIVKVDDVGVFPDGKQFMTMEHLEGRTLEKHMRQSGRLTPHHCLGIVAQIVRGLHELHQAGVVHRDLKPGNVFLTVTDEEPYWVVLIDLGIAHDSLAYNPQGFRTQTGMAMGTPGYMPPEQMTEAGSVTSAADLYAVGVILWEMLTGALPWSFESSHSYYFKQRTETPVFPADVPIPPAWLDVLLATLAPNVAARPRSLYAFLSALGHALPGDHRIGLGSGIEIVARYAKVVLQNAPLDGETVRAPNAERVAALMSTPQRLTHVPHRGAPSAPPLAAAQPTPAMPATVNERPASPQAAPEESRRTTLSAAAGTSDAEASPPSSRRFWLVALALAVLIVGGAGFLIAHRQAHSPEAVQGASAPVVSAPATSAPAAPVSPMIRAADTGSAESTIPSPSAAASGTPTAPMTSPEGSTASPSTRSAGPPSAGAETSVSRGGAAAKSTRRAETSKSTTSTHANAGDSAAPKPTTPDRRARQPAPPTVTAPASGSAAATPRPAKFDPDAVME